MIRFLLITCVMLLYSCKKDFTKMNFDQDGSTLLADVKADTPPTIHKDKNTIKERFSAPENYKWIETSAGSYGEFLENFPLEEYGSPIFNFNGSKGITQNLHEAVFKIDVGTKDLQQCADAIIRLRAEYLFKQNKQEDISFHFTSGDACSWKDYKSGIRPVISGNKVSFRKSAAADDSQQNFRKYLDLIFTYAGTISVFKESNTVSNNEDLQTGDFVITPGSPGHVVFIAGVSKNEKGEKLYLLGEGFTPAQSISIMKNPNDSAKSPWYKIDLNAAEFETSRYVFSPVVFKRY